MRSVKSFSFFFQTSLKDSFIRFNQCFYNISINQLRIIKQNALHHAYARRLQPYEQLFLSILNQSIFTLDFSFLHKFIEGKIKRRDDIEQQNNEL
jgi:hypothetical protein